MNNSHKIKAFTLNEMLVVLLLTAIVVGLAFSVLQLVQRQMQGIGSNYEKNTAMNLLRQSLWIDFNRAHTVEYNSRRNELLFFNELQTRVYQFEQDKVIREKDTFYIQLHDRTFYFGSAIRRSGEIDALNIQAGKEYGGQRIFVYKTNAAATYMNL